MSVNLCRIDHTAINKFLRKTSVIIEEDEKIFTSKSADSDAESDESEKNDEGHEVMLGRLVEAL
jgi:hypothetical protein